MHQERGHGVFNIIHIVLRTPGTAHDASTEDFAALYRELQTRCAATKAGVNVRAFLQEMEAARWLTG